MSVSLNDLPNKVYSSGDTVTVTTGSGIEGPQGPTGATGAGGTVAYFGNFFSTETQNNAGATVASTFTLNSTVDANGVSIVDSTKITFAAGSDGTYDLQFSVQFDKTDSGTDEVDVWLSKNGNYEAWSNTTLSLVGNNAKVVAAWNFQLNDVVGGDYFELHWWSPDTSMRALAAAAGSNPTRPAVPSIIVTVAQVTYTQAGTPGAAATVAVGTTTTGAAGTSASVVNSGTSSAAVLDFTIPRGDTGATGPEGGTSTLTTKGDLLTRTSSAVARLPVGATTGHVLTVDPAEATGMKWAAASGGGGIPETLIDAKGDLIVGSAADTAARLALGATNGHVLAVDSAQSLGVKWTAPTLLTQPRTTLTQNNVPYSGIPGLGMVGNATNIQLSANSVYYMPLISTGQPLTLTSAVLRVTTAAAAGNNVRLAIYNANSSWQPTSLVSDIGEVLVDSLGRKAATGLSILLPVGFYLTMLHVQATVSLETWAWSTLWFSSVPITQNASAASLTAGRTYGVPVDPGSAPSGAQHNSFTYGYVTYTW